jgi:molybdate transport system ATP-binding protein
VASIAPDQINLSYKVRLSDTFELSVSLSLPRQGITAIFGRSGSGKTTLLRCIAGLQASSKGRLRVGATAWQDEATCVPTHRRSIGYVFQENSLLTHLNVRKNLEYGFRRAANPGNTQAAVDLMGITDLLDQYPDQLSGGERQRVAIARALLINPELLLLDEPLASLDTTSKQQVLPYLERIHAESDTPVIYVSHALDEVTRLADHLVILDKGQVLADGPLEDVLALVDSQRTLGEEAGVVVTGVLTEKDPAWQLVKVQLPDGVIWLRDQGEELGNEVRLRILARDISIAKSEHSDSSILNRLSVTVDEICDDVDEALALIRLSSGSTPLIARITRRSVAQLNLSVGQRVWAQVKSVALAR